MRPRKKKQKTKNKKKENAFPDGSKDLLYESVGTCF